MATKKTSTTKKTTKKTSTASSEKKPKAAASKTKKAAPKAAKKKAVKKSVTEEPEKKKSFKPFVTPPKPRTIGAPMVSPPKKKAPEPAAEAPKKKEEPKKESPKSAPPAVEAGLGDLPPEPDLSAPATEEPKKKEEPVFKEPQVPKEPVTKVFNVPQAPIRREPPRAQHKKHRSGRAAARAQKQDEAIEATGDERKKIQFNEMMTVKDLAEAMNVKPGDVIKKLLSMGALTTINQRLESEPASLVADAFGFELELKSIFVDEDEVEEKEEEKDLKPRSPVVTVMGHVDHGKTSLLDAIREARVVEKEAGGITQHIGAYQVEASHGSITFLDTPGHAAFTAMRARGATLTDIVILVVAADDSVMPQTVEAIDHAKAAKVPIVVAINKMDLPAANSQKVKQELSQYDLVAEDWGGKTQMVEVSARTNTNIDKLLEAVLLESEILELKANPDRPAKAVVLEAKLDPRRGVTVTVLVQAGTLKNQDAVVCGLTYGRIRAMHDHNRKQKFEAGPSVPVEILGLNKVPQVGDHLSVVRNDREAREIAERRAEHAKAMEHSRGQHTSLESLHSKIAAGELQELTIVLKADVQGSLQAIQDSLGKLSTPQVSVRFVHTGVGNINDSDVLLAETSDSIVFGFNVKVEGSAEAEAKKAGVDIRLYNIIYEILADVRAALEGLLKPMEVEVVKGRALVKGVFPSSKYGKIAGVKVEEGKITRGQKARLMRNGEQVGKGTIVSLKRFKDDVREVEKGYECGLSIDGVRAYEPNDRVEVFVIEKQARRLEQHT